MHPFSLKRQMEYSIITNIVSYRTLVFFYPTDGAQSPESRMIVTCSNLSYIPEEVEAVLPLLCRCYGSGLYGQ